MTLIERPCDENYGYHIGETMVITVAFLKLHLGKVQTSFKLVTDNPFN